MPPPELRLLSKLSVEYDHRWFPTPWVVRWAKLYGLDPDTMEYDDITRLWSLPTYFHLRWEAVAEAVRRAQHYAPSFLRVYTMYHNVRWEKYYSFTDWRLNTWDGRRGCIPPVVVRAPSPSRIHATDALYRYRKAESGPVGEPELGPVPPAEKHLASVAVEGSQPGEVWIDRLIHFPQS